MLAGVVVGGMNRPIPATLGGFSIGFAYGILGGVLPPDQSQYLPSFLFAAVIVVLLLRPNGLFTRGGARRARMSSPAGYRRFWSRPCSSWRPRCSGSRSRSTSRRTSSTR